LALEDEPLPTLAVIRTTLSPIVLMIYPNLLTEAQDSSVQPI